MAMMSNKYAVEFFWSDEDEGFIAVVPDLPGCSAFGESRSAAAEEVEQAITAWIAAAQVAGNPVPEPSPRSSFDDYSGKLLLRMPKELHHDLQQDAKVQGTSLNSYVCYLLTKRHHQGQALKEFANSLQWHAVGFRSGASTQHMIQLASVTNLNEPSRLAGSTAQKNDVLITPLARFGTL